MLVGICDDNVFGVLGVGLIMGGMLWGIILIILFCDIFWFVLVDVCVVGVVGVVGVGGVVCVGGVLILELFVMGGFIWFFWWFLWWFCVNILFEVIVFVLFGMVVYGFFVLDVFWFFIFSMILK